LIEFAPPRQLKRYAPTKHGSEAIEECMNLPPTNATDSQFDDALKGLHRGDFDALTPCFFPNPARPTEPARIVQWHAAGKFRTDPIALAEALTCASFLGATAVGEYLLQAGVDPTAGVGTGMDALHWAVNRGQLKAVTLLLKWGAPLEGRNMHDTTVLGTAVWSALNEPRPDHKQIIKDLLRAGARLDGVEPPAAYVEGRLNRLLLKRRLARVESILRGGA
jgi:hypothetical protein